MYRVNSQNDQLQNSRTCRHILTKDNKQDTNETDNKTQKRNTKQKRKAILQEKPYKRRTGIKTVNPDRNVDKSQIRAEFVLTKRYIS
jgi:hypothetical protein